MRNIVHLQAHIRYADVTGDKLRDLLGLFLQNNALFELSAMDMHGRAVGDDRNKNGRVEGRQGK